MTNLLNLKNMVLFLLFGAAIKLKGHNLKHLLQLSSLDFMHNCQSGKLSKKKVALKTCVRCYRRNFICYNCFKT